MLRCGLQRYYARIRTFGKLVVLCALSKLPTNILLELNNYSNNIRKTKVLTVGETLICPVFEALDQYVILRVTVINKPCRSCTSRKHVQSNMNSPVCCWGVLFCHWQAEKIATLNKSENAKLELFAIYIQNYANQECKLKYILMFKCWVMHNSKSCTDVVTRKHMAAI